MKKSGEFSNQNKQMYPWLREECQEDWSGSFRENKHEEGV